MSQRQRDDMVLLTHICEQHRLSLQNYGRPRMTEELQELGLNFGQGRVGSIKSGLESSATFGPAKATFTIRIVGRNTGPTSISASIKAELICATARAPRRQAEGAIFHYINDGVDAPPGGIAMCQNDSSLNCHTKEEHP